MRVSIRPFTTEHLEPAAALLAARHRSDISTASRGSSIISPETRL